MALIVLAQSLRDKQVDQPEKKAAANDPKNDPKPEQALVIFLLHVHAGLVRFASTTLAVGVVVACDPIAHVGLSVEGLEPLRTGVLASAPTAGASIAAGGCAVNVACASGTLAEILIICACKTIYASFGAHEYATPELVRTLALHFLMTAALIAVSVGCAPAALAIVLVIDLESR